ncbi:MAG: tyrosine-type recombinase/integrase [Egibacteraceae bacterium]
MANSSVRQIHFILQAALGQAVKWGWLSENPAALATRPRFTRAEIQPLSVEGVTRLLGIAWEEDPDLGTLLWVAIISGSAGGAVRTAVALRLAEGDLLVARNCVQHGSALVEKDTKTHQARRTALDELTVEILTGHRQQCEQRARAWDVELLEDGSVFSSEPDGSIALKPHSVTQRVGRVARKAGVDADLRRLRHFIGMAMLTEGTDLRTVAGRLGHAGGGRRRCGRIRIVCLRRTVGRLSGWRNGSVRPVRPGLDSRTPADRCPCLMSVVGGSTLSFDSHERPRPRARPMPSLGYQPVPKPTQRRSDNLISWQT